jgi:S1-C subfamily serine protease
VEASDILCFINGRPVQRRVDVLRALNPEVIDQRITVVVERNG